MGKKHFGWGDEEIEDLKTNCPVACGICKASNLGQLTPGKTDDTTVGVK